MISHALLCAWAARLRWEVTFCNLHTYTCTQTITPALCVSYHHDDQVPDIPLRVGGSKVGVPDGQALQVGRLGCLGRRLTQNSYQMIFTFVSGHGL